MAEKDYLAMWFNVRRKYGIQDTIYWGWYDPKAQEIDWKTWRHADADGMAGFAHILRKDGFPCDPLPVCSETSVPGWKEIIKAQRDNPIKESAKTIPWRKTYINNDKFMPEVSVINKEQTTLIYQQAKARKVSSGNIIFSALSRVIARELVEEDAPFYWFYPVNVRGATDIKTESFNQVSCLYLLVDKHSTAEDWQAQMRTRMKAKQHWKNWKLANLGKIIGERGVSIIYKFTSGKHFYAGSCTNLGTWPLADERNPPIEHHHQLVTAAPGTANYPISSCVVDWNGSIALTLKLNSYICKSQDQIKQLLQQWHEEVIADIT